MVPHYCGQKFKNRKSSVYLNGTLDSTAILPTGNINVSAGGFILGREQDCVGGCFSQPQDFNGVIDEVRIYNRILSTSEINELYNLAVPVNGTIKSLASHTVDCKNETTGQVVNISASKTTTYDCEAKGLKVSVGDSIAIVIKGNAQ